MAELSLQQTDMLNSSICKVNGAASPGDEIKLKKKGTINAEVTWTSTKELTGRIEFICNGKVVATQEGTSRSGRTG